MSDTRSPDLDARLSEDVEAVRRAVLAAEDEYRRALRIVSGEKAARHRDALLAKWLRNLAGANHAEENARLRAELEALRDFKDLLAFVDDADNPVMKSWAAAHKHHADEPYIGCVFCRDKFVLASSLETDTEDGGRDGD